MAARWPIGTLTTFYALNSDFNRGPEESSTRLPNTYKSVLEWVIKEYDLAPHNLDAFIRYDGAVDGRFGNRVNEVFFVNDPNQACSDGCTYNDSSCSAGMLEADVRFRKVTWTTSTFKLKHYLYAADKFKDFRSVALHEFGHAFGLNHTATTYNLMGDSWRHSHTNGATSVPFIGADDTAGLVRLYGTRSGARPEISVSHWRFTSVDNPANPEYSSHRFESIYDSAGGKTLAVTNVPNSEERLYTVKRGQVVKPEFSLESTGLPTGTAFEVRYYLSTDDDIGVSDRLIGTFGGQTLGANASRHYQQNVQIPANAATGRMNLGIIVDVLGQIAEDHDDPFGNANPPASTGNATYIPVTVVP